MCVSVSVFACTCAFERVCVVYSMCMRVYDLVLWVAGKRESVVVFIKHRESPPIKVQRHFPLVPVCMYSTV